MMDMVEKRQKNNAGLTLLELMFASGIVAMALALLFGSLISMRVMGQANEDQVKATAFLGSILEEVNALAFDQLGAITTPTNLLGPGKTRNRNIVLAFTVPKSDGSISSYALPYTGDISLIPNPVEVKVTLTWQDEVGRNLQMVTSTMKGR
jgi:hypothetical protein